MTPIRLQGKRGRESTDPMNSSCFSIMAFDGERLCNQRASFSCFLFSSSCHSFRFSLPNHSSCFPEGLSIFLSSIVSLFFRSKILPHLSSSFSSFSSFPDSSCHPSTICLSPFSFPPHLRSPSDRLACLISTRHIHS